ncbi:MAG: DUF6259 domain-containing protein [Armatimonadota bacterium]
MSYAVRCRSLLLRLDEGGRAISLVNQADGYDFLAPGTHPVGLWQLGLIRPVSYDDPLPPIEIPDIAYEGHEWMANRNEYRPDLALDSNDAPAPLVSGDENGLMLTYAMPIDGGSATVVLRIDGGAAAEDLRFTASVVLPEAWAIKSATFPRLRGFGDRQAPQDDRLLYPENWGVLRSNPLDAMTNYTGQYPSAVNWCQMAAWLHGQSGLYFGVLDPDSNHTGIDAQYVEGDEPAPWSTVHWYIPEEGQPGYTPKAYTPLSDRLAEGAEPTMQWRINHWPEMASRWNCPYPVALRGFTGSWYEAGQIHRAWATQQRWCRRGLLAERDDASSALAGLDLWFIKYGFHPGSFEAKPAWDFQQAMHRLLDFFGSPFGIHWYNWHNFSWHSHYPTHFPTQEGFREVADDLMARGVVVMPYCQGRLLYMDRPAIEQERTHASIEANGQPYLEKYTPQDEWPLALCPADKWAQMQWYDTARALWKQYGVQGVYFDQIAAMMPSLCYHAGHGHPLGGGNTYWKGYDQALAAMEPLIAQDPRRFLSSELMSDAFMDRLDLYLSFVPPLEDYVPLHPAIYSGYTTIMGRATIEEALKDPQIYLVTQGEQLLFGGQLGWSDDRILDYPEAAACLRNLAQLRAKVRRYLHYGILQRPLDISVSGEPLRIMLPKAASGKPNPLPIEREAVRHTIWQSPEGGYLILLLNESPEERTVSFTLLAEMPAGNWSQLSLGSDAVAETSLDGEVMITVPALTVVALVSKL